MRKGRDFIRAYDLTRHLRTLYGITRESADSRSLYNYYKALTILADPSGNSPLVISMAEAAFLITDASWSSVTYTDEKLSEILSYAYELELPRGVVRNYYPKWKTMIDLINRAINSAD